MGFVAKPHPMAKHPSQKNPEPLMISRLPTEASVAVEPTCYKYVFGIVHVTDSAGLQKTSRSVIHSERQASVSSSSVREVKIQQTPRCFTITLSNKIQKHLCSRATYAYAFTTQVPMVSGISNAFSMSASAMRAPETLTMSEEQAGHY